MAMQEDQRLAHALVEFARGLAENRSVKDVLLALGDHCTRLLPVTGVGVLLVHDDDLRVATTNSPEGDAVEALEAELHEGPCVDAVRTGQRVLVSDLAEVRDRYPRFVPSAIQANVRSVHALPLTGRGEVVGALDIVNREPLALSTADLAAAQVLADVAVAYIFAVRVHEETSELASQLQTALEGRVVIEQAKGILAERHGEALAEAFERMRRHARSNNRTVRAVATDVVEGKLRV